MSVASTTEPTGDVWAATDDTWAAAVVARIEEIAAGKSLWPGFDPRRVPLALFDGQRTYLFSHPAPPEGFRSESVRGTTVHVYEGRHEAVIANTNIELGGVMTATLMRDGGLRDLPPDAVAAVAIHEAFHVYQFHKPDVWKFANEAVRFLYPITDASLTARRLVEIRALRRALERADRDDRLGWAKRAIRARRERLAAMDPSFAEYERRVEMVEGLAAYMEGKAAGRSEAHHLDENNVADVRRICYGTGHAWALLLDEAAPQWKEALEQGVYASLDEALGAVLDRETVDERDFSNEERDEISTRARDEVRRVEEERARLEAAFASRQGRRLAVEVGDGALFQVFGMDPTNAHLVSSEHVVLHVI